MSVRPVALVFAEEKDPTSWRSITSWERSPEPTAQMESHDPRDRPWSCLAVSHLLSHMQQKLSVAFIHATHQPAELGQKTGVFAGAAPGSLIRSLAFREIGQLRRFLAVVEELIEWNLQRPGHFLQRLDRRNRVAVFDAGDVTTEKASALFDVSLGKLLFFSKRSQTVADNHGTFSSGLEIGATGNARRVFQSRKQVNRDLVCRQKSLQLIGSMDLPRSSAFASASPLRPLSTQRVIHWV